MAKAARGAPYAEVERFALSLPEVTPAPHHDFGSWRVRGKIFVTVPPARTHLHVFVPDSRRDELLELHADFCERLLWGGKVVGLRVTLAAADPDVVRTMVRLAWEAKAPKRLLAREPTARGPRVGRA